MLDKDKILEPVSHVNDPELQRSLTDLKLVREMQVHKGKAAVAIAVTVPNYPMKSKIESDVSTV